MPLILGTNSIKDTSYDVANSLRFHGGNDDSLNKTLGTPTNNLKWSISFWIKRTELGVEDAIITASTNSQNRGMLLFRTDDTLDILDLQSDSFVMQKKTNRKFRDPNAWYSILITSDATLSSPATKIYVNGVEETSFATSNEYSQNQANKWNSAISHHIGNDSSTRDFSGYLAEFVFVDGQVLNPTDIGEFDSDSPNIWKPKDVSGLTFGNNGFHLDFENASSLGADVSGNSNNFTVNNLTSVDQSTDTCTNNFNVFMSHSTSSYTTLSNGGLTHYGNSSGDSGNSLASFGVTTGKWYFEVKLTTVNSGYPVYAWLKTTDSEYGRQCENGGNGDPLPRGFGFSASNTYDGSSSTANVSFSQGDIIGVAIDLDNGALYVSQNGTFINSSDPTSGSSKTNAQITFTVGDTYSLFCGSYNGSQADFNFGSPPYSISSGNSDGSGFGNFEYSVPSGYYSLCTKNLADHG